MKNQYHQTITDLEKQGVSSDYILGWASGFLGNPKLEEQRISDAYQVGYEDGAQGQVEHAEDWLTPP